MSSPIVSAPTLPQTHVATLSALTIEPGASRDSHLAYLATLRSDQSRRTMAASLSILAEIASAGSTTDPSMVPWHGLTNAHAQALATTLAERFAPATARQRLCAFRGVMKSAWRAGLMDRDTLERVIDVAPVRGSREPAGRALEMEELRALFATCAADPTPAGARDSAVIALMAGAGLRRTEAASLDLDSVDLDSCELRVLGKGNKERVVPMQNGTLSAVADWIDVRGEEPGPLLVALNRGGKSTARRLTGDALLRVCQRRADQSGVKRFSPHDLRRTFASCLLDAGGDISAVQGLMGHSSVVTTQRYDRRGERAKRKAAGMLYIPYQDSIA
jgi:site-specific recombinase XerC